MKVSDAAKVDKIQAVTVCSTDLVVLGAKHRRALTILNWDSISACCLRKSCGDGVEIIGIDG